MASVVPKSKHEERLARLRNLHLRRNEARKLNHAEVVEEDRRSKLPANFESRKRKQEWELEDMEKRKAAEERGEDYERVKALEMQADVADKIDGSKKRKKNPDMGFSNYEDSTLRQHQRLTKAMQPDLHGYIEAKQQSSSAEFFPTADTLLQRSHYPSDDKIDAMVADLDKQQERREKHHRRRIVNPNAPIDFINERNRRYNELLNKFYDKYTEGVKEDLERGTAV